MGLLDGRGREPNGQRLKGYKETKLANQPSPIPLSNPTPAPSNSRDPHVSKMPSALLASHALASSSSSSAATLLLRASYSPAFHFQHPAARPFSSSPHHAGEPASIHSRPSTSQQVAATQLQQAGEGMTEGPHFRGASRLLSITPSTLRSTLTLYNASSTRQHSYHPFSILSLV